MKAMKRYMSILVLYTMLGVMLLSACTSENIVEAINSLSATETEGSPDETIEDSQDTEDNDELIDETHSKEANLDYDVVFPQDEVNEITITISEENWTAMMADMEENYGEMGTNNQENPGIVPEDRPAMPKDRENMPPEAGGMGMQHIGDDNNPIWVTTIIQFEDETWKNVGIRFKGNSSLSQSWSRGDLKLPFKLDFDEFEDAYPEIEDQRFYGFKQLSFSSNFKDLSYLREKVTADIFRDADVPSAQTAFYAVYLDNGSGIEYIGLYTVVEVVDDTVIETQFEGDDGNVYKPEGICATFAVGTYNEECYDKETNQDEDDYSDLISLLDTLHSNLRLTDSTAWRTELESVFNVAEFINYLAVNTVVQNWDTYGVMGHNYYLYTDSDTGLVNWIPWDNNGALRSSPGGMVPADRENEAMNVQRPVGPNRSALSISLDEVNEKWPLIRYLLDDEVYAQQYAVAVEKVITDVFTVEKMSAIYDEYSNLIEDYISEEAANQGVSQLNDAVTQLKSHVAERVSLAEEYLAGLE